MGIDVNRVKALEMFDKIGWKRGGKGGSGKVSHPKYRQGCHGYRSSNRSGVEPCTSLATFLKFPPKTTEDVVESKATLARAAARANEPLGLHRRATPGANGRPLTVEFERVTRTSSRGHVLRGHNRVDFERVDAVPLGQRLERPVRQGHEEHVQRLYDG